MKLGQQIYNSVFPPTFDLKPKEKQLMEKMYPDVNWDYVRCYDGLPWFMHYTFAIGTALPSTYNGRFVNIYFRDHDKMSIHQRTLILVHEAFHIQQYQELQSMSENTSGWGFNRRFMRYYLSWYFQGLFKALFKDKTNKEKGFIKRWQAATHFAYRRHPMEIPAYNHEAGFAECMGHYRGHSVNNLLKQVPQLVVRDAELPKPPALSFGLMGGGLSLTISLIKPFIEGILLIVAMALGGRDLK